MIAGLCAYCYAVRVCAAGLCVWSCQFVCIYTCIYVCQQNYVCQQYMCTYYNSLCVAWTVKFRLSWYKTIVCVCAHTQGFCYIPVVLA